MQENEFEKQVKATIDGFRLRPSEPVWPKIREEIRDKRRRRILLLIPVLAALTGLGYFAVHSFYGASEKTAAENKPLTTRNAGSNPVPAEEQKQLTDINKNQKDNDKESTAPATGTLSDSPATNSPVTDNTPGPVPAPEIKTLKETKTEKISNPGSPVNSTITGKDRPDPVTKKQLVTGTNSVKEKLLPAGFTVVSQNKTDKNILPIPEPGGLDQLPENRLSPDNTAVATGPGTGLQTPLNLLVPGNRVLLEIPLAKNPVDLKRSGKIRWGINFSVGLSSRTDQPFKIITTEKSSRANADFLANQPGTGSTGNVAGGGLLLLPASGIKAGTAYRFGITVDKPLSKRLDVSAGIQYEYASDHVTIGKTIYTVPNRGLPYNSYATTLLSQTYYAGMQPQNHTNKYQLIGLPVQFHYNLTRKWSRPLIWNAGAEISRIISSDVLLYDQTWGGLYYQGDKEISKTQFGVTTGFSIRLTGHNQWQWRIGPQVAVNTTPLFHSSSDKNKHIVYGSLNLQLLLPGKKR